MFLGLLLAPAAAPARSSYEQELYARQRDMLYPVVKILGRRIGSGVVIDRNDGSYYIITNNHVVRKHSDKIKVEFVHYKDNSSDIMFDKQVKGIVVARDKKIDLALIKVQYDGPEIPVVKWAPADYSYQIGETVYAGVTGVRLNPFLTQGIIGSVNNVLGRRRIMVTAPIIGGNSGGGLFAKVNGDYSLIGIVLAHQVQEGFPIPHISWGVTMSDILLFLEKAGINANMTSRDSS